ncbi:MAG TPA: STAUR_1299 family protein [Candidatus Nanopelagicales bacterium]|nr:STAUR_1299 family protein [Candidatus Nanopelagicales bacterium]
MMDLDLTRLYARAFHAAEAARAAEALSEARLLQPGEGPVRAYEVIVPEGADLAWLEGGLLRSLVYFCESTRAPLPGCAGVFVALFAGDRLHCVAASEVVAFGCEALGVTPEELVRRHGTGEVRHALRRDD